jgi:hypothetical protein
MLTSKLDTVSGNNQIWLWLNGSTEISAGTYNGKFTCFIWTPVGPGVGPVADEFDIYITGTVA